MLCSITISFFTSFIVLDSRFQLPHLTKKMFIKYIINMEIKVSRNQRSPKYREIIDHLMILIQNGREMDKLPTEIELSHRFGVSHITVRRAIAELEKKSLVIRLPGRGTFIRKVSQQAHLLKYLVVLPAKGVATAGYLIPRIISGIVSAETENAFDIQTFSYNYGFSDIRGLCAGTGVSGVIWIGPNFNQLKSIKELEGFSYPVIGVNRVEPSINFVSTDHEKSSEEITEFLIKRGHKRIGFVGWYRDFSYISQRYRGFLRAFEKAGLEFDEAGLVKMKMTPYKPFEFHVARFKADFLDMCRNYKPSAIFILGCGLIEIVLDAMIETGIKVPDDVEVATFDEVPERYEQKKYIHEVIQPLFEMGKLAAEYLEKLMKKKTNKVAVILPSRLNLKGGEQKE